MTTHHGAVGDPSDEDDVFGPVEDGEEVFEWIDDGDDDTAPGAEPAERTPAPTFRERLAAVRSGGRRLRRSRREIAAAAAALVLACAVGGACTAWFDSVAGASDRASVVSLALDSVVDGDPAVSSYNAANTSATAQYVAEIANNSPDAVYLKSVSVDAGTLMTSTGWKPLSGSARIPGGGTAKVALSVKLFCPMVVLSQQTGMLNAADGTGGGSSLAFPALNVEAENGDGVLSDLVLPSRVTVSSQLARGTDGTGNTDGSGDGGDSPGDTNSGGDLRFVAADGMHVPQIVSADSGACREFEIGMATDREAAGSGGARFPSDVAFHYDKVLSPTSDQAFILGFTVKNTSSHPETLTARGDVAFLDSRIRTDWLPTSLRLGPGQSAQARLTVSIRDCTSIFTGDPVLGQTMLEETDDSGDNQSQAVFIDQALTGSLRLAGDVVEQEKAACS